MVMLNHFLFIYLSIIRNFVTEERKEHKSLVEKLHYTNFTHDQITTYKILSLITLRILLSQTIPSI